MNSVSNASHAASIARVHFASGLHSGILIANPIPAEFDLANSCTAPHCVEDSIRTALQQAAAEGITGQAVTPFLLSAMNTLTNHQSLHANIVLIKSNAKIGTLVAVELARRSHSAQNSLQCSRVVVVGASAIDVTGISSNEFVHGDSNSGSVKEQIGGVGRNVAEAAARLAPGCVEFHTVLGNDRRGQAIAANLAALPLDARVQYSDTPTAVFLSILDSKGSLVGGIDDMKINAEISLGAHEPHEILVNDGNVHSASIAAILDRSAASTRVLVPSSFQHTRSLTADVLRRFTHLILNADELNAVAAVFDTQSSEQCSAGTCSSAVAQQLAANVGFQAIIVTQGANGLYACSGQGCTHHQAIPTKVVSVIGAGDSLAGGFVAGLARGLSLDEAIKIGLHAAHMSLLSIDPVNSQLTFPQ